MPQVPGCHGNGDDHCCYLAGQVCPFLRENDPAAADGRRWSCGLFNELGDWDAVHSDSRYTSTVAALWAQSGPVMVWLWDLGVRCGSWGREGSPQSPGMGNLLKVKGNDDQWKKDFQSACIAGWQTVQQGGSSEFLCCHGNASYAQDGG